jgi:alpha-N-acetylglucosamine transferase
MKLTIFSQTQYDRILHIDSDVMILQNMDDLFFLPSVPAAMPRAYWDYPETRMLSSLVILLEPSFREFKALTDVAQPAIYGQAAVNYSSLDRRFDNDILNGRYADSALVLPHRQYGLVTREFRRKDHRNFLGNDYEDWDPDRIIGEAKLIHFWDPPLPKPWVMWPQALLAEMLPKCKYKPGTVEESGCRDRDIWKGLYEDFRKRRKVCRYVSRELEN